MAPIKIKLSRGTKQVDIEVDTQRSVDDVKRQVSKVIKLAPERIRLFLGDGKSAVVLADEQPLSAYADVKEGAVVNWKDLGPQIGWRTVFVLEYLGPLLLYPLFVLPPLRAFIYGRQHTHWPVHPVQQLALLCWTLHYVKRELETLFVHKFSKGTMPLFNLWKNSAYYWGCTVLVSYFVNHPLYRNTASQQLSLCFVAAFLLCELLNLVTHLQLSALRPQGHERRYGLPRGVLFQLVTCPNYTFEVLAWTAFTALTHTFTAGVFTLMGFVQMYMWAGGKYQRYCREFPPGPGRKAEEVFDRSKARIFPPFL